VSGSPKSDVAQKYVDLDHWQIQEARKGLTEADRGDFASDKDCRTNSEEMDSSCS
jgi:predicted transcriptional regulator